MTEQSAPLEGRLVEDPDEVRSRLLEIENERFVTAQEMQPEIAMLIRLITGGPPPASPELVAEVRETVLATEGVTIKRVDELTKGEIAAAPLEMIIEIWNPQLWEDFAREVRAAVNDPKIHEVTIDHVGPSTEDECFEITFASGKSIHLPEPGTEVVVFALDASTPAATPPAENDQDEINEAKGT